MIFVIVLVEFLFCVFRKDVKKGEVNIIVILYNRNFIGCNDVNFVIYVFVILFEVRII